MEKIVKFPSRLILLTQYNKPKNKDTRNTFIALGGNCINYCMKSVFCQLLKNYIMQTGKSKIFLCHNKECRYVVFSTPFSKSDIEIFIGVSLQ